MLKVEDGRHDVRIELKLKKTLFRTVQDDLIECYDTHLGRAVMFLSYQVVIAQWLAWQLATGVVPSSNPGKGDNLLISD